MRAPRRSSPEAQGQRELRGAAVRHARAAAKGGHGTISSGQRALLHVARAKLGMSEEAYRALLARAAGVASSRDLDRAGFDRVIAELQRLGFRSSSAAAAERVGQRREGMATPAQLHAIEHAWRQFTGSDDERALARWLDKHIKVSHVRFLDAVAAGKCIAILRRMLAWKAANAAAKRRASDDPASPARPGDEDTPAAPAPESGV